MMDTEEIDLEKAQLHEDLGIQQPLASPGVSPRIGLLPFSSPGALVTPRPSRSVASRVAQMEVQQRRSSSRSIKRKKFDDEVVESSLIKTERGRMKLPPPPPPPYVEKEKPEPVEKEIPVALPPPEKKKIIVTPHPEKKKVKISSKSHSSSSSSKRAKRQKPPAPASTKDLGRWKPQDDLALITAIQQREDADSDVHLESSQPIEEWDVIGPLDTFGDGRIFDAKLCLIATMECQKHERLLHGLSDLLKDIKTDLFITDQDLDELLTHHMSQPYNPDDGPVTNVVDSKPDSTMVSDNEIHLDQSTDKPLRRVRPLQRQRTDPGSPNQMFMSKSYFRAMSNPCVCVPNLSARLMKFDKLILSFLLKIDEIASKLNQLIAIYTVTPASISMKPFARFVHSVNTTYDYIEHLLDNTTYMKRNSHQDTQIEENVEEIERVMTLGSSFLKSESTLTCRCCSNCVWLVRMFCGTSLRKIQNLRRRSVQQRAQLMKLMKDRSVQMANPPWQKKEWWSQQLQTTANKEGHRTLQLKPIFNVKPVTVAGVHESYKMLPKQEPPPTSSPVNQPWYPPPPSRPRNNHWQPPHVSSPGNIPWHPPPVSVPPGNQPWHPPMGSPSTSFPRQDNPTSTFHSSRQPVFGPRAREPVIFTRGRTDLRRQCIALRNEDPFHLLNSEMSDHHVGLPFGGHSMEDQDYRNLPSYEEHNRCPTPPHHQRRYHRNFHGDHNYRPFDRRPYRGDRHVNPHLRHHRRPLPECVTTHYIIHPFPEVDFASTPSQSSPLTSPSPRPSWSHLAHKPNADMTSPFFTSRSRPVGQETTASATCEPSHDPPSSRPPWFSTDHQEDHCTPRFMESDPTPQQGTSIPAIVNHGRPAPVQPSRLTPGRDSVLVSPPPTRLPRSMETDSVPIPSPSSRPSWSFVPDYDPLSPPPSRPPWNFVTNSVPIPAPPLKPPRILVTESNPIYPPPSGPSKSLATDSVQIPSPLSRLPKSLATDSVTTPSQPSKPPRSLATDSITIPSQPSRPPNSILKSKPSTNDIRQVIDETVNVKSCSTFSMKSFNPLHKARKFMTKCKELTSRKKHIKLGDAGSAPWQQEDGFQWVELNRKLPSPSSSTTTKTETLKTLGSSPIVEQGLKSPSNRRSSQPKPTVSTTSTSKIMLAGSSPKMPSSPRVAQSNVKKTSEGRSPKMPSSPRVAKSNVKKTSDGRSPKTPSSPRVSQSAVKKTSDGRSPKTPSSPRVSQRVVKKTKVEDASLSDHPVVAKSTDASMMTLRDKPSPKPSIPSSKKPSKPLRKPPSREDIELHINIVKNGGSPKPRTFPAVLRLPLPNSTEYVNIPTDPSFCPLSERCVTLPQGPSCREPHDRVLPSDQPDLSSVPCDTKTVGHLGAEEIPPCLPPVSDLRFPSKSPKTAESKKTLTPVSVSEKPVTSLASSLGPVRKIIPKRKLSESPTGPTMNENLVVSWTPGSSVINTNKALTPFNAVRTSTPKHQTPTARICRQVEIIRPFTSSSRHIQLLSTTVTSTSKVSLIKPRVVMKITRNAEMLDTYHVSSIQTTAVTTALRLTDATCGQRSSPASAASTPITTSVMVTSPMSTTSQSSVASQATATMLRAATLLGATTSQEAASLLGAATSQGASTLLGATTSQGAATLLGAATSLDAVALPGGATTLGAATSHGNASDSGSSTPDRLIIVTDSSIDDELNTTSLQVKPDASASSPSVINCSGRTTDILCEQINVMPTTASTCLSDQSVSSSTSPSNVPSSLNDPASPVNISTTASRPSVVLSISEQPSGKQQENHKPQINQLCAVTRLERSCASNSSVTMETLGRTSEASDITSSTVIPSSSYDSSLLNPPGWTPIELPSQSSRIPSQVTRNKMFLSSKLSSLVPSSPALVSVHRRALLKDQWKDLLTERTMADIMSTTGGGSEKLDSRQNQSYPKSITDVEVFGNPSNWLKNSSDLPAEEHRCCNSVQDILAEETLSKKPHHASPRVHISRKRLRPDHGDVSWIIQDKEYVSSHETDHIWNPPKRRQWSGGVRDTLKTASPEIGIQSAGNVSVNLGQKFRETVVRLDCQERITKCTTGQTTCRDRPGRVETGVKASSKSEDPTKKKPSDTIMPSHLTVRYAPLRKLRNTPPIAFQGKINEQQVREILSFTNVCVKNAYDYQTCRILPAAIATASNHVSPRYFARELVFMIFTIGELQGRKIELHNPRNRLMQSQILNPTKINAVKEVVLHKFPIEEFHWWERCVPFINDCLKSLFQRKLMHSAFQWIEGMQDCFRNGDRASSV